MSRQAGPLFIDTDDFPPADGESPVWDSAVGGWKPGTPGPGDTSIGDTLVHTIDASTDCPGSWIERWQGFDPDSGYALFDVELIDLESGDCGNALSIYTDWYVQNASHLRYAEIDRVAEVIEQISEQDGNVSMVTGFPAEILRERWFSTAGEVHIFSGNDGGQAKNKIRIDASYGAFNAKVSFVALGDATGGTYVPTFTAGGPQTPVTIHQGDDLAAVQGRFDTAFGGGNTTVTGTDWTDFEVEFDGSALSYAVQLTGIVNSLTGGTDPRVVQRFVQAGFFSQDPDIGGSGEALLELVPPSGNLTQYSGIGDLAWSDADRGVVLRDRDDGTYHRLVVDGGVLSIEAASEY